MTYKSVQRSLAGWSNLRYVARRLQAWFNRREAIEQAERARRRASVKYADGMCTGGASCRCLCWPGYGSSGLSIRSSWLLSA